MVAHQAPPSLGFSRQEHWSGLPFPSPMHESEKSKRSCSVAHSCCAFFLRVVFEEVSGHRVLIKSGPGNRGRSACGPTHVARLEFPRETGLILRCARKAGNPFHRSNTVLFLAWKKQDGLDALGHVFLSSFQTAVTSLMVRILGTFSCPSETGIIPESLSCRE